MSGTRYKRAMAAPPKPGETGDLFARVRPRPLGVGELTRLLRAQLEPRFKDVWVAGEIASLRRQSSGHLYFALKDEEASLSAVVWASQARKVPFALEDGLEVVVRGFLEIYPPHGKYQLVVQEVEPRGAGAQALLLKQLKERLQRDGLLDPERKRSLPVIPRRVGLATSPTGAALRDFLRVLHGRYPTMPVLVAPCRVQGEGAAAQLASALRALCRAGCDVVVVTRGGGSQDDLSAFNDERLARAIAACSVPVVSAVGHEVDFTVADLVADVRAATPTHAAQIVVPVKEDLEAHLASLRARLRRGVAEGLFARRREIRALRAELLDPAHLLSVERNRVDDDLHRVEAALRARIRSLRLRLAQGRERLALQEPRARVRALLRRAEEAGRRLRDFRSTVVARERLRLERLRGKLEPANVAKLLERGFALVLHAGRLVTQSEAVGPGDDLRVALSKGWLDARVTSAEAGEDPLPGRGR
ncbi:MAG TPA: exodeoxyribonuclease VII large subunit [Anaeromyxobacteraceae bacterium]|nr:exodeoxyribonuclease VII large subunit [Anaeromyxobacteraceae bacterium]